MAKKIKLTNGDDDFIGSGKDERILGKEGNDSISGGGGNDVINGGPGNDVLKGGAGDDRLLGGVGDDTLLGGTGDDSLNAGAGTNSVDGGEGDDTVTLDGNYADATITKDGDGYKIVTAGGTTTVKNVELFQFADGTKDLTNILVEGKTFTLTTTLDNVVGTIKDDLIAGNHDGTAASTFNSGDVIDGGEGIDTLRVAITSTVPVIPSMKGVENFEVTSTAGGGGAVINLVNTTDVKSFVSQGSTGNITFDQQNAIAALTIQNGSGASGTTIKYTAAAVAGTTDVQTVALNNNGSVTDSQGDITVAGVETIAFTNTGGNFFNDLVGSTLSTVTSEGAGSLSFDLAFDATVKTFDASKATGAQTVGFLGNDVTATGGTADDYFNFNASLTSKDVIDGGTGVNTVALDSGDYTAAASEVLKGLNATKNIQTLEFYGATSLALNHATLTAAAVKRIEIDTTAADTISGALSSTTYAFNSANTGAATFTMKAGDLALNLELNGKGDAAIGGFNDADVGALNTGTALTVNLVSKGASVTAANVNDIGTITHATNAQFNITGDANTHISFFGGASALLDASKLTGNLTVDFMSAGNDTFKGGSGVNYVAGWTGVDTIDLSASSSKVDTISNAELTLDNTTDYDDRDVISGFKAGSGGDLLRIDDAESSGQGVAGVTALGYQEQGALVGTVNILPATDILEFAFNIAGTGLGDGSAGSLNGTNLLAGVGTINATNNTEGWLVAYQGGNAYLYHYVESNADANATVDAGEISLMATLNGVAVGEVAASNFLLV